jgi:hypothetical protein
LCNGLPSILDQREREEGREGGRESAEMQWLDNQRVQQRKARENVLVFPFFLGARGRYTQSTYTTLFPHHIILDKCELVHSACTLAFLAFQATGRVPCFQKKNSDLFQKISHHILWWINMNKSLFVSHLDNNTFR